MIFLFFLSCQLKPLSSNWKDDFLQIHRNIYDVYSQPQDPIAIHNLLQKSFAEEALTQEYMEHFSTLAYMESEETHIDIKQIDYHNVEILEYTHEYLRVDADWSVGGIVTHQKHKHPRVNRYRAAYTLERNQNDEWRIVQTKMRNMERVQRATLSDEDFFSGSWDSNSSGGFLDPLDLIDAEIMKTVPSSNAPNEEIQE